MNRALAASLLIVLSVHFCVAIGNSFGNGLAAIRTQEAAQKYVYNTYRRVQKSALVRETSAQLQAPKLKPYGLDVCPNPASPCQSKAHAFATYELPFRLPTVLDKGTDYKSVQFYAVIVKTYDDESCDADDHTKSIERERVRIQRSYPTRKVFAEYSCPNLDAVTYDFPGKNDATGDYVLISTFIAIYAGTTPREGDELLSNVKAVYPRAMLKHMTAHYEVIDQ